MTKFLNQPFLLINPIQNYPWGSKGKDAFIPALLGINPNTSLPYAELWVGAHTSAPSHVKIGNNSIRMDKFVEEFPIEILGATNASRFGNRFPFLFKILSAAEILSIQAHPSKDQAKDLFINDPLHYPDDNHKPELAIALDSLSVLIGFKPLEQINLCLLEYPELSEVISNENLDGSPLQNPQKFPKIEAGQTKTFLSTLLNNSMTTREKIQRSTGKLLERLKTKCDLKEEEVLFTHLFSKYPGDPGLWLLFLMNLVHLEKHQSVYIGAGVPHAYVKGHIIECMANSDNVVRAGLTDKFIDTSTLLKITNLDAQPIFIGGEVVGDEVIYKTPADEFQISRYQLEPGKREIIINDPGPIILFVMKGKILVSWIADDQKFNQEYFQGQAVLIPAILQTAQININESVELIKASVPNI